MMARYLPATKALFQHIPRTGGTWVESILNGKDFQVSRWADKQPSHIPRKHAFLSHYHFDKMHQVNFVFSFVRHPLSLYESRWRWLFTRASKNLKRIERLIEKWTWHPQAAEAKIFLQGHHSFDRWVERMLIENPSWVTRLYESYVGPEGGEFCDFIGRTESLAEDLITVLKHLELPVDEDRIREESSVNANPATIGENIYWDTSLQNEVIRQEAPILRRFYGSETLEKRFYHTGRHDVPQA